MSGGNIDYSTLQDDILTYLQSVASLSNVFFFAVKDADITSQVNTALSGGMKTVNGKAGASVSISKPFLVDINPEAPGPTGVLEVRFETKVKPVINNGANGTKLTAEQIDLMVLQALLGWTSTGSASETFYAPPNASAPAIYPEKGFEGRLLRMRTSISVTPVAQTVMPAITDNGELVVTIAVASPDSAAPVLFTTDGSCPGYIQGTTNPAGTSTLYTEPFTVTSGTYVRAVAIAVGKLPSIIADGTITPG